MVAAVPVAARDARLCEHVDERFALRRHITFDTSITSAVSDADRDLWEVETDRGERVVARFLILDVTGKRVGVIGTGSSGIQVVPQLAAGRQRTSPCSSARPTTASPRSTTRSATAGTGGEGELSGAARGTPFVHRNERPHRQTGSGGGHRRGAPVAIRVEVGLGGFNFLGAFEDIPRDLEANALAAEFVRDKIRSIVHDDEVADLLTPIGHPIGSKRICVDTGYYETFNRSNVQLVSVRDTPSRRSPRRGYVPVTSTTISTSWCWRPVSTP